MTLRADAYKRIREAILRRELGFAERTSERALARRYFDEGSRTPVREALAVLAATGIVEQIPQVGVEVRRIDSDEALRAVRLRAGMEPVIVEALVSRGGLDSAGLRRSLEAMESAFNESEPIDFMLADTDFHTELTRLGGFGTSLTALEGMRDRVHLFRLIQPMRDSEMREVIDEHSRILGALEGDTPDAAVDTICAHLDATQGRIEAAAEGQITDTPVLAGSGTH
jgi:DNA-binding GntR family transcriptional regulator